MAGNGAGGLERGCHAISLAKEGRLVKEGAWQGGGSVGKRSHYIRLSREQRRLTPYNPSLHEEEEAGPRPVCIRASASGVGCLCVLLASGRMALCLRRQGVLDNCVSRALAYGNIIARSDIEPNS